MALRKAGKHEEATTFRADNVVAIKGAIANGQHKNPTPEVRNMDADKKREEIRRLNWVKDQFAKRLAA